MSEQDQEKKKVVFKVNFSKQEEMPREKEEPQMELYAYCHSRACHDCFDSCGH